MYSMVVLMALSSGVESPNFCFRSRCHGCYSSCSSYCHGCYSSYCHGCYGGCYGGCYSSCYGCTSYYCSGCYGGGYGCHGCYSGSYGACYGCTSVYCSGCGGGSCAGYYSGCYSPYHGSACHGCAYSTGSYQMKKVASASAPATIVVNLPAEAKLTVDGVSTKATSARRVFTSPELEPGKKYFYTLKASVMREGKEATVEKRVEITAGNTSTVSIEIPAANKSVAAR